MSAIAASSSAAGARLGSCSCFGLLLLMAAGCGPDRVATATARRVSVPSPGDGARDCLDVGEHRVCYGPTGAALVPRVLPAGATPAQGWRCDGRGAARVCEDRARNGSPFECGTQRCLQERPRMPDDGEWECVEIGGVGYCHSRGALAGSADGPLDLGWRCGPRRGQPAERICVDLDGDRPPGADYACRYELQWGTARRSCQPAKAASVGSRCDAARACPSGSECREGVCLPALPEPACWLDGDCGYRARCVFGSCAGA